MVKVEDLAKKVVRLKKKLAGLKKKAEGEKGADDTRLWHKRLKRAQRRKKLVEVETTHMQNKKTKKKTGEEGKEAAAPGASAA